MPKIAIQYRAYGLAIEDLVGEGNLGLIEAARRFDPCRGTKFSTYAIWWIRRERVRWIENQARSELRRRLL